VERRAGRPGRADLALLATSASWPSPTSWPSSAKSSRRRRATWRRTIAFYLKDLAGEFHATTTPSACWSTTALRDARVALAAAVRQTIRNGMAILGVGCPESM
jgi:arginyl-tRNA synthetase